MQLSTLFGCHLSTYSSKYRHPNLLHQSEQLQYSEPSGWWRMKHPAADLLQNAKFAASSETTAFATAAAARLLGRSDVSRGWERAHFPLAYTLVHGSQSRATELLYVLHHVGKGDGPKRTPLPQLGSSREPLTPAFPGSLTRLHSRVPSLRGRSRSRYRRRLAEANADLVHPFSHLGEFPSSRSDGSRSAYPSHCRPESLALR